MKANVGVRTVTLQRALVFLNSIGAKYKIITDDGSEYGELTAVKIPKRQLRHPFGSVRNYYRPLVEKMQVGDVVTVPAKEFSLDQIQSGIGSFAGEKWGLGSVVTHRRTDENAIEVLRVF